MKSILVTHVPPHQADEVTAVAILKTIMPEARVHRTRDASEIQALSRQGAFLLDVGGVYDPERNAFDHHQPQGAGVRPGYKPGVEWPYATAGLVWKHYGTQAVSNLHPELSKEDCDEVVRHVDEAFIRYVDAVDCGVRVYSGGPSWSSIVAGFNPSWFEGATEDQFPLMVALTQTVLENFIRRQVGKVLARVEVRKAATSFGGKVLTLERCMPWSSLVAAEYPEVLLVLYPTPEGSGSRWQMRTAVNEDGKPRMRLPAEWAGLEGARLQALAPGAVFCHRSRHLAGAVSLEAIQEMAGTALQRHEPHLAEIAA